MKEKVFLFLNNLFSGKYESVLFLSAFFINFSVCLLNIFLSILKRDYTLIKRLRLSFVIMPFLFCCLLGIINYRLESVGLLFCFWMFLFSPVLFIRVKSSAEPEKIKDIINKAINSSKDSDIFSCVKKEKEVEVLKKVNPPLNDDVNTRALPDFTHVKNVLERLWEYPLSAGDKKQLKDLENAIILIENGNEPNYELNDELGALLKIMSKYGV